jgi:hypothetical protein
MNEVELSIRLRDAVNEHVQEYLGQQPMRQVLSVDWMEALARTLLTSLGLAMFDAWKAVLEQVARQLGLGCPGCGKQRKCKTRASQPMEVNLLGLSIEVPKLYLECGHCDAPGISITKLLTGLRNGATSAELELRAGYLASQHSYGKASRDLEVHYQQPVERTSVRRMALRVEAHAVQLAERSRHEELERISAERRTQGCERLMLQGDGGSVRTGQLVPCEQGDPRYGKKTPKTGQLTRKRVAQNREIITLDVREPGESEPSALDVVVPVEAAAGERERRMLALAARKGLGDNTEMFGLGDLGSNLPSAFEEAFVGYDAVYSGDWKHVRDYVHNAASVLEDLDTDRWQQQMRDAIWNRDERRRDALLEQAHHHRVSELPKQLQKCPVKALQTYLTNNWKHMQAALFKEQGLDFVSARAEAQVRDRTKARFAVPGAWRQENLEPKATLRAIIAEGRWEQLRTDYLQRSRTLFDQQLTQRLEQAIDQGRLRSNEVAALLAAADEASFNQSNLESAA